ncbi:polysaccharide deacetylase family protein [Clostridium formicaceticum]|uniref:Peptidoglycan-N-acetylglucosamine deacetylase n=1 Tax=Clostridium formicaceticum TaxID=1497 RepID=A0AAC9RIP9_9CLOT|nr:polysaccharide deacetylase family protein [Clostridium formicaceticum]AOY75894.1 hypothetical protein BJL90_08305 [Clostridium formicaceticum]ARE86237.1 Peptidoglycan-N-acetylglucosamine deacetylase [Clostridium formicaceticum]
MKKKLKVDYLAVTCSIMIVFMGLFIYRMVLTRQINSDKVEYGSEIVWNGPTDQKIVALTFDDGPHPRYTPKILDLLKEYDIKATFFVLGKHVERYPETVKRMIAEGHEIGNHTYSHINVRESSKEKIEEEFEKTQRAVFSLTGVKPQFFRPPFGFYNEATVGIAREAGCKIILWSTHQDSKDWSNPGIYKIIETVLTKTQNGDIILLHDYVEGESQTLEALKEILPELKNRGYSFVTISQVIEMNALEDIKND